MDKQEIGKCDKCGLEFRYYLIHNGFNESSYAYCDNCGKVTFLNIYSVPDNLKPIFIRTARHHVISKELEKYIEKCPCGGNFKHDAAPRCPICKNQLSAEAAREYIEKNAERARKHIKKNISTTNGWKWQGNWNDFLAIVIENNKIYDNWKLYSRKENNQKIMESSTEG